MFIYLVRMEQLFHRMETIVSLKGNSFFTMMKQLFQSSETQTSALVGAELVG